MSTLLYVRNSPTLTAADLLGEEQTWQAQALCAQTDPEIFYPPKGGDARPAKRICAACPVSDACLEYALDGNEQFGVWGGKTEKERRALKRAPRGASIHPIVKRQRHGLAKHHHTIAAMLAQPTPATWAQIGTTLGWTGEAVKKYWHRQKQAAEQQEQAA